MKLKEYITALKDIEQTHPDVEVVHSSDDEGNTFGKVYYHPALGRFEGHVWKTEGDLEEDGGEVNAVCIN
jgi:hypothetical protein